MRLMRSAVLVTAVAAAALANPETGDVNPHEVAAPVTALVSSEVNGLSCVLDGGVEASYVTDSTRPGAPTAEEAIVVPILSSFGVDLTGRLIEDESETGRYILGVPSARKAVFHVLPSPAGGWVMDSATLCLEVARGRG